MDDVLVRQQVSKDILQAGEQLVVLHRVGDGKGKANRTLYLAIAATRRKDDPKDTTGAGGAALPPPAPAASASSAASASAGGRERIKVLKIKGSAGHYRLSESWRLEDVRKVDALDPHDPAFTLQLEKKPYTWIAESPQKKAEFLAILIELCRRHLNRLPQIKNVNEATFRESWKSLPTEDGAAKESAVAKEAAEAAAATAAAEAQESAADPFGQIDWDVGDAAALEKRLIGELLGLEAANVYSFIQSDDEISRALAQVDTSLQQLDVIDDWLEKFNKRLEKMGRDIKKIERKNNSMQTRTVNQQKLLKELESLLKRLLIDPATLNTLTNGGFSTAEDVRRMTAAATRLHEVFNFAKQPGNADYGEMAAVREKLEHYREHQAHFSGRLHAHLEAQIEILSELYLKEKDRYSRKGELKLVSHEQAKARLRPFYTLTSWLRDLDPVKLEALFRTYNKTIGKVYKREISLFLDCLRQYHVTRDAQEDVEGFVFSSVNSATFKTPTMQGLTSFSTVSHATLPRDSGPEGAAKQERRSSSVTQTQSEKADGSSETTYSLNLAAEKLFVDEALEQVLCMLVPVVAQEEEFARSFFHLEEESLEQDAAQQPPSADRRFLVGESMSKIFDFLQAELISFVGAGTKNDPTMCVSLLVKMDAFGKKGVLQGRFMQGLLEIIEKTNLATEFETFLAEQVRAIAEVKVTPKKRSGILDVFRTYQHFVSHMERLLEHSTSRRARDLVDSAYRQIADHLFDVLAALENSLEGLEPKDVLNGHIIITENGHHFYSQVSVFKNAVLVKYTRQAKQIYDRHLSLYVKTVIQKPLGKLLEFFEGIDQLLLTRKEEEVGYQISYNKNSLRKVLAQFPAPVVKKGLEQLRERVDKHFSDEEGLQPVVWRGIQEELIAKYHHFVDIIARCYPQSDIALGFSLEDLLNFTTD